MSVQNDESYDSLPYDAVDYEIHQVPVASLLPGDSPRVNGEDEQHISMLAQLETELPPILVQRGTMRVIDGMHRLRAAVLLGRTSIQVKFFDGTDAEAFIAGVKANSEHGLTLTLADREAAAARIVALYPERSDRWTAAITGLAPGTVSAVRRRIPAGDELASRRIGRDGRVRPLDSAEGRRIAAQMIAEHPDASLREIAKMAGISPGTVRDVRRRIDRGEDAVLRKLPDKDSRKEPSTAGNDRESRRPATRAPKTRDLLLLLTIIQRDPSLRQSENGRDLLRWLKYHARGPDGLVSQVESIPQHCAYLLAEFARSCANEWLLAARTLEQRVDDAAQLPSPPVLTADDQCAASGTANVPTRIHHLLGAHRRLAGCPGCPSRRPGARSAPGHELWISTQGRRRRHDPVIRPGQPSPVPGPSPGPVPRCRGTPRVMPAELA